MSFIFQSFNLFPGLTVTENVEFGVDVLRKRGHVDPKEVLLVVTHNREISRMADRVVELSSGEIISGEIISDGPPAGGKTPLAELHW